MDDMTAAAFGHFGREDELRALRTVLTGGGSAVVTGEPGLGKSSLLKIADQIAQRSGHRVLVVAPTQFDRGLPFSGLAELVAQVPDGVDKVLPDPQRRALAVALRREAADGHDADPLAVQLAVRTLVTELCARGPVAVIVDDLQWLDPASAASLGFALRRLSVDASRLGILVGTRPIPGVGAELLPALPDPRHDLRLTPLDDDAMGQVLRNHLGARWTPPTSRGITRACGGNPFLGLMIAQAMQSDLSQWWWNPQDGSDPVFPVPPSLAEILGEKVSLLPAAAQEVLLLVSAAGRLTVDQLAEVFDDVQLREALAAAADWDVATVGAGAVVEFAHPMLASAIYDAAPPGARRRVHHTLAELLADPVERARHRARTVTAPDEAVALELAQAAEASRRRGAQALAGELDEAAARATPASAGERAFGRWLSALDSYLTAGDALAAQKVLDNGITSLDSSDEARAELMVRRFHLTEDVTVARTAAEQGLELAPPGSAVRAQLLRMLAAVHRLQGDGPRAHELATAATRGATDLSVPVLELAALSELHATERLWGVGDRLATRHAIEDLAGREEVAASAELVWARSFCADPDDADAEHHARRGIADAVERGRYGDLAPLYTALVMVLIRASRIRDAQAALAEADRIGAWSTGTQQEEIVRALVDGYAGHLDDARVLALRAADRPEIAGSTYWRGAFLAQLGFVEVSARNWQAALDHLRSLADIFDGTGMVDLEQLLWAADYADAALQLGETADAVRAIEVLRRQGAAGRPAATAAADRCQALLTATRGDVDAALHALVQVADQQGVECPFEAARSRLALGQVYRRAGYKAIATETLGLAAEAFEEIGTPRWAERARDDARRIGLTPTTSALTETERRIAELVATGHSNQVTAAELFISVKTVEANLTRIYRKLAVRSRTELAHRFHPEP